MLHIDPARFLAFKAAALTLNCGCTRLQLQMRPLWRRWHAWRRPCAPATCPASCLRMESMGVLPPWKRAEVSQQRCPEPTASISSGFQQASKACADVRGFVFCEGIAVMCRAGSGEHVFLTADLECINRHGLIDTLLLACSCSV